MITKINLSDKFQKFSDFWSPKIIEELNNSHLKLAKLQGEFVWHHHKNEDELFIIVKGQLLKKFRDKDLILNEGELVVVPRGVEHKPVAKKEVHFLLIEPKRTINTGNVLDTKTQTDEQYLY